MGIFLATTGLGSYVGSLLVTIVNSASRAQGKICSWFKKIWGLEPNSSASFDWAGPWLPGMATWRRHPAQDLNEQNHRIKYFSCLVINPFLNNSASYQIHFILCQIYIGCVNRNNQYQCHALPFRHIAFICLL